MSNDFFSLRDLRKSRSKNFLDADDIAVMTLEDSVITAAGYVPWRNYGAGGSTPPEVVPLLSHHPASTGKPRKPSNIHVKQGHSSIDNFFAKRDRRKNRKEAGRIVPAEAARRLLEINASYSAGDADSGVTSECSTCQRDDVTSSTLQVVKAPPDGWDAEGDGDGDSESASEVPSWPNLDANQSRQPSEEERQVVNVDCGEQSKVRAVGAYVPPQLRRRLGERAATSDNRQLAGPRGPTGTSTSGPASTPDIGCLDAFPPLSGGGGGSKGARCSRSFRWGGTSHDESH